MPERSKRKKLSLKGVLKLKQKPLAKLLEKRMLTQNIRVMPSMNFLKIVFSKKRNLIIARKVKLIKLFTLRLT